MSEHLPSDIRVSRQPRQAAGSCNNCTVNTQETVLEIDLRTSSFRLCDECAAELVKKLWTVGMLRGLTPMPIQKENGDWEIPQAKVIKYWRCPDCGHRATTFTRHGAIASINALIRRESGAVPLCRHKRLAEEMQNTDGTRSTFDDVDD